MSPLSPPYPYIWQRLGQGKVIPFLGAGASLGERAPEHPSDEKSVSYLPSGSELTTRLAKVTNFPQDEPKPDLAIVAQYFNVVAGRDPLQEELHGIFDWDYPITPLHSFLASIDKPLLIATTNYDDLIERAFVARGRPYDLVIHTTRPEVGDRVLWVPHGATEPQPVNPNKLDIDLDQVTVIYKMHGAIDRRDARYDQYVITEDDYIDFLVRMTKNKAIPAIFADPFQQRHFLFLGYGLRDWNLRVVLSRIDKDLGRSKSTKSWAVQYRPSTIEQRFWQERSVEVYDLTIQEFVQQLASCSPPSTSSQ